MTRNLRSYKYYADLFGESKKTVKTAMDKLESLQVIRREFRIVSYGDGLVCNNVMYVELKPDMPVADTKEFQYQWEHWCSCSELYHRRFNRRCSADFQDNWHCRRAYQYCNRALLDKKSKSGNIELLDILSKGGAARTWLLFYC